MTWATSSTAQANPPGPSLFHVYCSRLGQKARINGRRTQPRLPGGSMLFLGLISLWIEWFVSWKWSVVSTPLGTQAVPSLPGLVVKATVVALGSGSCLWLACNLHKNTSVPRVVIVVIAIAAPFFVLLSKL